MHCQRAFWRMPATNTLTLWTRLSRFLEHPELELSNNLAENAMRQVAPARHRSRWKWLGSLLIHDC